MRWQYWLVVLGVAGALLPELWVRLRSVGRIRSPETVPGDADVLLVLGAGVRSDGLPSRILRGRLLVAKQVYDRGTIRKILVSGSPYSRGHSEPVVMRAFLLAHGVPESDIAVDESGVDTWHSALAARATFGGVRMVVVTTNFHLRRSIWLCRRMGMDAFGVGHDAKADGLRRVSARGARREALATVKAFWWPRSRLRPNR